MASAEAGLRRRLLAAVLVVGLAACGESDHTASAPLQAQWPMYGGSLERRFFNANETRITKDTVAQLIPRWRFLTDAVVMASPIVADVELPTGVTETVFVSSWDRNFYALRATDGSRLWSYRFQPHPGSAFQQSSTAAVADLDNRRLVYVASGETMHCLDAATGRLVWQFDVGTGCTNCDRRTERNEISSSPAVVDGVVYFGMDVNELPSAKGGLYALDARNGSLRWYFDLETGATCRPRPGDNVRRFDGFHSAASLGLPENFFATRPGCNFDRTPDGCGNIWSSPAIDVSRRTLYITSGNCDVPAAGSGDASPYDEAIFAVSLDGDPWWTWRPRPLDPNDIDFGAPPNLFTVDIAGAARDVVGAGGKDGTYYLLDRNGINPLTGRVEPYWKTNVVPGGSQGGIIAPSAVGDGKVLFSTGIGDHSNDAFNYQKPTAWALFATDGTVAWSNEHALPSFAPTSAIPGIVFMGSIAGRVSVYDANTGASVATLKAGGLLSSLSSAAVVVDGQLYVGAGTGAREGAPESTEYVSSLIPSPLTAFCLAGSEGCPLAGKCNDANPCTVDTLTTAGSCSNTPAADATPCMIGTFSGLCQSGVCTLTHPDCDDHNQCTIDMPTATGCAYASAPAGTPCVIGEHAGTCTDAFCDVPAPPP